MLMLMVHVDMGMLLSVSTCMWYRFMLCLCCMWILSVSFYMHVVEMYPMFMSVSAFMVDRWLPWLSLSHACLCMHVSQIYFMLMSVSGYMYNRCSPCLCLMSISACILHTCMPWLCLSLHACCINVCGVLCMLCLFLSLHACCIDVCGGMRM